MGSCLHVTTAMQRLTSVLQAGRACKPSALLPGNSLSLHRAIRGDVGDVLSPALQAAAMQGTARLYTAARDSLNRQLERFETFALETCLAVPPGLTSVQVRPLPERKEEPSPLVCAARGSIFWTCLARHGWTMKGRMYLVATA